jgi:hypothetical protein
MKTITKARRKNAAEKRACRTFAGYIGLLDGRPDSERWPTSDGPRVLHVFLNERKARKSETQATLFASLDTEASA